MSRSSSKGGFTLLELLVSLAVLSVVSTIGIQLFFRVSDAHRELTLQTELEAAAGTAFDLMRRDFENVISPRRAGADAPLAGTHRIEDERRYQRTQLEDDSIILPVEAPGAKSGTVAYAMVRYQIDRSEGLPVLRRSMAPLGSRDFQEDTQAVVEGALSMRIEYYDGNTWQREWQTTDLPEAVRVSITLQDSNRTWEQIARVAVFPIYVE